MWWWRAGKPDKGEQLSLQDFSLQGCPHRHPPGQKPQVHLRKYVQWLFVSVCLYVFPSYTVRSSRKSFLVGCLVEGHVCISFREDFFFHVSTII